MEIWTQQTTNEPAFNNLYEIKSTRKDVETAKYSYNTHFYDSTNKSLHVVTFRH